MNEIIIAVLSLIGTIFGSFCGVVTSNKLVSYRIEQLEKKVSEHNRVVERTFHLEESVSQEEKDLDRISTKLEDIETEQKNSLRENHADHEVFKEQFKVTNHRLQDLEKICIEK